MKKKILALIATALMLSPVKAYASGTTSLSDPGIAPDSILYGIDQLTETVQLVLTPNGEKEAILLEQFADERLAESTQMIEEDKNDLAEKALNDYAETLEKITSQLDIIIEKGTDITDTIITIDTNISENQDVVDEIINALPEDSQEAIKDKVDEATSEIDTTKEANDILVGGVEGIKEETPSERQISELQTISKIINDQAFVDEATKLGLNSRQLITLKALSDKTEKPLSDILKVYVDNNKDMGATLKALGLKAQDVMKSVNESFKTAKEQVNATFKAEKKSLKPSEDKKTETSTQSGEKDTPTSQEQTVTPTKVEGEIKSQKPTTEPQGNKAEEKKPVPTPGVNSVQENKTTAPSQSQKVDDEKSQGAEKNSEKSKSEQKGNGKK